MSEINPNRLQDKLLIFPCGGISSVGRLTLLAAQELILEGKGEWVCLHHFKGLPQIGKETAFTSRLIVVDGCEKKCGEKYVAQLGRLLEFHLSLADLGIHTSEGDIGGDEDLQLVKDAIIAESTRLTKQPALFIGSCSCR
ncbi:MAG: putative zinc-binding protein [Desulforhopalus sp.]